VSWQNKKDRDAPKTKGEEGDFDPCQASKQIGILPCAQQNLAGLLMIITSPPSIIRSSHRESWQIGLLNAKTKSL
jgi:hypothetical protein